MTHVDFYILGADSTDARLSTVCRLSAKAVQRRRRIYVNSDSEAQARVLDERLWTFSQGSFIPHRIVSSADRGAGDEPVLIGFSDAPADEHWHIMINLAEEVPDFFSRYERVVEIVDANPERRAQGRARYRFYKERGYNPATHNI